MNQLSNFNKTLAYLENCLDGTVDEKQVFILSGYSYPLFSRIFSIMSGLSLREYLRFRKLTKAAIDIANTENSILSIALQYGYESHNSFSTAFKNFHGISPNQVRKGEEYKVFSPLHFSLHLEGGNTMDIKIEKKAAFSLAGISITTKENMNFGGLWQKLMEEKDYAFLTSLGTGISYGACFNVKTEEDFSYMAGFDVQNKDLAISHGLEILEIPEANYAIIPLKGKVPNCIHEGWKYVMGTFLPENGLKHAGTPDLEVYSEGDMDRDSYTMQLWVPVEKSDKE